MEMMHVNYYDSYACSDDIANTSTMIGSPLVV